MALAEVIKAANFAAERHRDQRRKDPQGTPYINHPIGVANILINEGKKKAILIEVLTTTIFHQAELMIQSCCKPLFCTTLSRTPKPR